MYVYNIISLNLLLSNIETAAYDYELVGRLSPDAVYVGRTPAMAQ